MSLKKRNKRDLMIAVSKLTPKMIIENTDNFYQFQEDLLECMASVKFLMREYKGDDRIKWLEMAQDRARDLIKVQNETTYMPTIGALLQHDREALTDGVEWLILDTIEYLDVNKESLILTAADFAFEIVEEFKFLTLEDIMLCFKYAKDGIYGTLYNRLDGQIIKQWLLQYWEAKQKLAIEKHNQNHVQTKELKRTVSEEASYRYFNPKGVKDRANAAGAEG